MFVQGFYFLSENKFHSKEQNSKMFKWKDGLNYLTLANATAHNTPDLQQISVGLPVQYAVRGEQQLSCAYIMLQFNERALNSSDPSSLAGQK